MQIKIRSIQPPVVVVAPESWADLVNGLASQPTISGNDGQTDVMLWAGLILRRART